MDSLLNSSRFSGKHGKVAETEDKGVRLMSRWNDAMRSKGNRLAGAGLLLAVSALIAFLEGIVLGAVPFVMPGVRLGFANIVTVFALLALGGTEAFAIAFLRPFLVFLFSGNVTALALSLTGSLLSFFVLIVMRRTYAKVFTLIGISALCAFAHGCGQLVAVSVLLSQPGVLVYGSVFLPVCVGTGAVTGAIMNWVVGRLSVTPQLVSGGKA